MTFFMETTDRLLVHGRTFEKILSEESIQTRVDLLGEQISARFADDNPLFMPVLNGAFIFAADLIRRFRGHCQTDFVRLSSYQGDQSGGQVRTVLGIDHDLRGRHLIVVEDIVDTGRTIAHFLETLRTQEPASISVAAFLRKPEAMIVPVPVDYLGFDIPNRFVVGYGLDFDGHGRNLPAVYGMVND
ncbi:MAG: hypoxanthine phosphoribosyltransferase [Saprospiraceae bacterium]|nr:hypoxanthine phosphoribosyltransferase [Saprospiraceae bacterium]